MTTPHPEIPYDLFHQVLDFFDGDSDKTAIWWNTGNPLLGNVSPTTMILLGREKKLRKWITLQLASE